MYMRRYSFESAKILSGVLMSFSRLPQNKSPISISIAHNTPPEISVV